jgi:hypothetical protein
MCRQRCLGEQDTPAAPAPARHVWFPHPSLPPPPRSCFPSQPASSCPRSVCVYYCFEGRFCMRSRSAVQGGGDDPPPPSSRWHPVAASCACPSQRACGVCNFKLPPRVGRCQITAHRRACTLPAPACPAAGGQQQVQPRPSPLKELCRQRTHCRATREGATHGSKKVLLLSLTAPSCNAACCRGRQGGWVATTSAGMPMRRQDAPSRAATRG